MSESQQAWDDVAQQFRSLGRHLQQRYREQSPSGEQADRTKVDDAVRTLADAVENAIESVGSAVRDTEFRDQAKQVAQTLVDAIGATFTEFGDDIRAGFPPRYTPPGGNAREGAGAAEEAEWEEPAAGGSGEPGDVGESEEPQGSDDPAEFDDPVLPQDHQPT